jgi:hypothetical protein
MQYKRFACNNLLIKVIDWYVKAVVHKFLTFPRCAKEYGHEIYNVEYKEFV